MALAATAGLLVATVMTGCGAGGSDMGLSTADGGSAQQGLPGYPEPVDGGDEYADWDEPIEGEAAIENGWVRVADQPVSTFSSDVDTASYTLLRHLLNSEQWYDGMEDQIRIEEMINYFDYDYRAPNAGAARPFNVDVKVGAAPWEPSHQLARIGVKAKEAREATAGNNVVLLLDTSGSMGEPNKLPLLVESFKLLAQKFDDRDRVSIVTYAGSSEVLLDGVEGNATRQISKALDSLQSGGSTAGSDGLKRAYNLAAENFIEDGNNRIILATDGDFNVGPSSVDELETQITIARERGVFVSVFGFGMFSHDDMMETIADNGNGNYFYIDSLAEAERALVDQFDSTMFTVAKDLKLQVAFNPAEVARYRLIGYENRVLANEDFADDAVDAGDVGAGSTVTALYELVPGTAEAGDGDSGGVDSDYPDDGTWMTVATRYKEPTGDESRQDDFQVPRSGASVQADDDWRFAAAVAEFGMILRHSENQGDASIDQVRSLATGALGDDPYGLRAEFVELVGRYAASLR
jgi:Ca-activated chloride channel family protein